MTRIKPISAAVGRPQASDSPRFRAGASFRLYQLVLAWSPFPLGSNRAWSWSVLVLAIALCALLWTIENWKDLTPLLTALRIVAMPMILGVVVLGWSMFQCVSWSPDSWQNPIWAQASSALHQHVPGAISMNPWRSGGAAMKLGAYLTAALLCVIWSRDESRAYLLLRTLVMIGASYAVYAVLLTLTGHFQFELFYDSPAPRFGPVSGPFVLKNSYATYAGLMSLAAVARLLHCERDWILGDGRGPRGALQWRLVIERNALSTAAFVLSFATLVASASRAGFISTLIALTLMLLLLWRRSAGAGTRKRWTIVTISTLGVIGALLALNGALLDRRLGEWVQADGGDTLRHEMLRGALGMIYDRPLLGMGMDTFEDAYPQYSENLRATVIDKAHNDYVELAAGLGLPMAAVAVLGLLVSAAICLRGLLARRRQWAYPLLGAGASSLVAAHSLFDFSLQIPAVALLFVTMLGLGLGQSVSSKRFEP